MAIAEIKWKLVKDTYFFDTTTCYLSEDGNHMFYSGGKKQIKTLIDDFNELVRKGCAMWLKLGEYDFALDKLSKCPTQTWYSIHQMLYSLEPWGVIKESKKSARKSIKESMNLNYEDFDYDEFVKYICNNLTDVTPKDIQIICDKYGFDVEIDYGYEDADSVSKWLKYDSEYNEFIFGELESRGVICLKMPIIRAKKIAEEFSPKVLKVNDDSILIGDKNSDTKIWLDVWTDNDGDEDYTEWDYNQQSFNLNNYEDMVQKYLQQIDDFFYILDGEVSDNF